MVNHLFGARPEAPTNPDDVNMINMIQAIMGQVFGSLGGQQDRTIAEFLNALPDYNYVAGESLVNDLLMTLAQHMNFNVSKNIPFIEN